MSNFFHPDNAFMRFLSNLCDLIMLNILFVLTSLPIFTIGCAISSMYSITIKMQSGEDPFIIKGYFKAFKRNFKQSTIIWIPMGLAALFFLFEIYIIYNLIDPRFNFLQYPVLILLFVIISILIYAFPILSTYNNTTKQILKNSVLLSLGNFPTTIFIVVIFIAIGYFAISSNLNLILVLSILLFFGFAGLAYFISLFLVRIFDKCKIDSSDESTE